MPSLKLQRLKAGTAPAKTRARHGSFLKPKHDRVHLLQFQKRDLALKVCQFFATRCFTNASYLSFTQLCHECLARN